jgi:glycosyltransferase involved in cell wall biosynthesis
LAVSPTTTEPGQARRRILFLNWNWIVGGQEVVLLDILARLDRSRYEAFVVCYAEGLLVDTLRAQGIRTFLVPPHRIRQPYRLARAIASLMAIVVRERIDVIHCNGDNLLFYGALAAAPRRVPCVWHVYEPVVTHGNSYERFFYLAQRQLRAAFTIFGTAAVEESYLRDYPRLGPHAAVMPGVDVDALTLGADANAGRAALGLAEGTPILLVIGRLQRTKGHDLLLEAAAGLAGDFPAPHFVFCGGAPVMTDEDYPTRLRGLVDELGLTGRVHFTGQTSEAMKRHLLAAATLLVHPAHREAFGIVVLEGMAAGKPVVVTDAVGPASILAGSDAGVVVPRRNAAALRDALRKLLSDPAQAQRMGERGRVHVRERYGTGAMAGASRASTKRF